ncbi:MAG: alanine racemase [Gemmatimonadaceae bacterium]
MTLSAMAQHDRPAAWAEIDEAAIRHNLRLIRKRAGGARVYVVCKGHGYGFDAVRVAGLAEQESMDALACGTVGDVVRIRDAGVTLPILLYATTLAQALPTISKLGVTVTAHDELSLHTCLLNRLPFSLKLDSGFARLGFTESNVALVERAAADFPGVRPMGVYTHLSDAGDEIAVRSQAANFGAMADRIAEAGWEGLERMVASSRILISHPDLILDAVNPGRAVYGMLEPPYDRLFDSRPALAAVRAHVIALKRVRAGTKLGYAVSPVERDTVVAIAPFGFANGYPRMPAGATALLRGCEVEIIGPRHTEHTVLDVSGIPDVEVGDVVTFLGKDGDSEITAADLVDRTGVPMIELVARLASGSPASTTEPG